MQIDETKLNEFVGRAVGDLGAGLSTAMVIIGDRLGLYRAMAKDGSATPAQLAKRTGTSERYVREWLNSQAAGGYVTYDTASGEYTLPPEQAMCLADENSPAFLAGGFELVAAALKAEGRISANFVSGKGMEWGEHDAALFRGTERFFRPNYAGHLVKEWIPALDGVEDKLQRGARVADVGCGLGSSTILMAQAFPRSRFTGYDYHPGSIELARKRAAEAKVGDRVEFEVAAATSFPGDGYDLVACFDCLHDMADPAGAARHVRQSLAPEGTWLLVEPFAGDKPERNHNPVGRVFYAASTLLCVPCSLAGNGPALGAQAGEAQLRQTVVEGGGFTRFRRAAETPFNLVFEARP